MITQFPKIFTLGQDYVSKIFEDEVEVTEKVDGCVSPDEKVLTVNLEYVRAGDLKIGDKLIGFDEKINNSRIRESVVTCNKLITKKCFIVNLVDGRRVIASEDHPWVVRFPKKTSNGLSKKYVNTSNLKAGMSIVDVGYWDFDNSWDGGYVAGQYDGEGSLVGRGKNHNTVCLSYYQKESEEVEFIYNYLVNKNFKISRSKRQRKEHWKIINTLIVRGGWVEVLRFLGTFRPKRLLDKASDKVWQGSAMNAIKDIEVEGITYIGDHQVVGLSTTTKTYIVNGLLCHNSQFVFGKIDGELQCRSKEKIRYYGAEDKMFKEAVDYVYSISDIIPDNTVFYCEYLKNPKHNVLAYQNIPKNHLALFGVGTVGGSFYSDHGALKKFAELLNIDVVPLIYYGPITSSDQIVEFLDRESFLGGQKIEGVVVKNYYKPFLLGGQPIPVMSGKMVSERFKEVHREKWGIENTSRGKWQQFKESFKTEARWEKAVQHLNEKGELENSPRDIGKLIAEIKEDISDEEKETIKEFLWTEFGLELLRESAGGFPEWYKKKLLDNNF